MNDVVAKAEREQAERWAQRFDDFWEQRDDMYREAEIDAMLPLVREHNAAVAAAHCENSGVAWRVVADVGKALGLDENATIQDIIGAAVDVTAPMDPDGWLEQQIHARVPDGIDIPAGQLRVRVLDLCAEVVRHDRTRRAPPPADAIDPEDLWTDYRTERRGCDDSHRLAFLAGVDAGRRTMGHSAPLTEEEARDLQRLCNALRDPNAGHRQPVLRVCDLAMRLLAASRRDIPADDRLAAGERVTLSADYAERRAAGEGAHDMCEPRPMDVPTTAGRPEAAPPGYEWRYDEQCDEGAIMITPEQARGLIRAGWCDLCPHREEPTCPDPQCPKPLAIPLDLDALVADIPADVMAAAQAEARADVQRDRAAALLALDSAEQAYLMDAGWTRDESGWTHPKHGACYKFAEAFLAQQREDEAIVAGSA